LVGKKPVSVQTFALPNIGKYKDDNVVINVSFEDGSIVTIEYLANGDKNVEKETMECFSGGKVAQLVDYRKLILTTNGKRTTFTNRIKQEKGHLQAWQSFIFSIKYGTKAPISFDELLTSSIVSIAARDSLLKNEVILIDNYANSY
jgi:hypothetical protein